LVLILAAILRLGMYPFIALMNGHSWEYEWIADQMIWGRGYSYPWQVTLGFPHVEPTAFMPPGQVMIDYVALSIFGQGKLGHTALFLEEVILSVLLVWLVYKLIVVCFHDVRLAVLGAWAAAVYPSFIIAAGSFGITTAVLVADAALLLAVASYFRAAEAGRGTTWHSVAIGVSAALLTFFRSEAYPVLAITFCIIAFRLRHTLRAKWPDLVRLTIVAFLVVSPWIVRNYVVLDRIVLGSTSGGFNFWRGHNETATGSSWTSDDHAVWTTESMRQDIIAKYGGLARIEQAHGDYHVAKAIDWIRSHPAEELVLAVKKPILLWTIDWYSTKARSLPYIALYAITAVLSILGVVELRHQRVRSLALSATLTMIASWLVLYTLLVMAFFTLPRFQVILIGIYFPIVVLGLKRALFLLGVWEEPAPHAAAPQVVRRETASVPA
jgi:hypothetical protein